MNPEVGLFIPRASIREVNPPKIAPISSFRKEQAVEARFIPQKPKINYFYQKAASEYYRIANWYPRLVKPEVIVLHRPVITPVPSILESVKRIVQRLGLDRVLAWLKTNFYPQTAYKVIITAIS